MAVREEDGPARLTLVERVRELQGRLNELTDQVGRLEDTTGGHDIRIERVEGEVGLLPTARETAR